MASLSDDALDRLRRGRSGRVPAEVIAPSESTPTHDVREFEAALAVLHDARGRLLAGLPSVPSADGVG